MLCNFLIQTNNRFMQHKATFTTLTCPHCGDTKRILNLFCADTYRKEFWSDFRDVAPWMPRIFPIQKCLLCGKYYFIEPEQYCFVDIDALPNALTYAELKEAKEQFASTQLTQWQTFQLNQELLWAYNDEFNRNRGDHTPTDADLALYREVAQYFIDLYPTDARGDILRANLLCESGQYAKAKKILLAMHDPRFAFMAEAMLRHIDAHSPFPVQIVADHKLIS